ncbi:MAG: DNA gyrase inhibitor YacG [Bryobacteraceae bacterium]
MTLKCPICKRPVTAGDAFFPFCTERCKLIDLGNWATEKYVISEPVPGLEDVPDEE